MTGTPEHQAFYAAKNRCNNPNYKQFKDYGGRGIRFLYKDFDEFYKDVGPRPSPKHSLDRKEVNGHYEPGNCRWGTSMQQWRNRRVALISRADLCKWFGETEGASIWDVIQANYLLGEALDGTRNQSTGQV